MFFVCLLACLLIQCNGCRSCCQGKDVPEWGVAVAPVLFFSFFLSFITPRSFFYDFLMSSLSFFFSGGGEKNKWSTQHSPFFFLVIEKVRDSTSRRKVIPRSFSTRLFFFRWVLNPTTGKNKQELHSFLLAIHRSSVCTSSSSSSSRRRALNYRSCRFVGWKAREASFTAFPRKSSSLARGFFFVFSTWK